MAAFLVTVLLAVFQRMTGPSYPIDGELRLATGESLDYSLPRSNEGRAELEIRFPSPKDGAEATLEWRRWPTDEPFRSQSM